jgi:TolB-like protein/Flp pilus assembly protein TadD
MGVTYRAHDKVLHREVALKVIDVPAATGDLRATRERFLREARSAAAFRHPNVASVFQFGALTEVDRCYYAMELVEGETLEAFVRREGPLKIELALEMAIQVTRALIAAAAHGLIHRDLKPANIMLAPNDSGSAELEVKVIDFGLAKATADAAGERDLTHGGFVGTPTFASPEQLGSAPVDARSDIYSLGVTLWYSLTGELPCPGKTIVEIRSCQTQVALPVEQLLARKVPAPVIKLLSRTLATDPAERPQSARTLLGALELCRGVMEAVPRRRKRLRRAALALGFFAICTTGLTSYLLQRQRAAAVLPPEKSIAVLPFENLSADPENAFFTDGVQDEILNDLAKIADLKVISRTSVMQYKTGVKRNLREIAKELGVAQVVEGSVQRSANRVRVSAQLIDARNDTHVWVEKYDRELADVFVIQSEIAQAIADQLQAKLSPTEKSAMNERPTSDMVAYDLYLRAKKLFYDSDTDPPRRREDDFKAVQLLDQAIARDPAFLLAHCQLAYAHDDIYFFHLDHTETRLALAETSVRAAVRLQPDSGETHFAQAIHFYWGYLDYDLAREELAKAQHALSNNVQIFKFLGLIDRRQGHWDEAVRNLEHAVSLDPLHVDLIIHLEVTYFMLHRYEEALAMCNRALALEPRSIFFRIQRSSIAVEAEADTAPLRAVMNAIEAEGPSSAAEVAEDSFELALRERDPAAAARALANIPSEGRGVQSFWLFPHAWGAEGLLAKLRQDAPGAHSAFMDARAEAEKLVAAQPRNEGPLGVLALIDAELGDKEKAIREGRTACDMVPPAKDALDGVGLITNLATIYALTGEKDLALQQLEIVSKLPNGPSYGELRLDPEWDSLHGDPRFEKIVADLRPKPSRR